MAGKKPVPTSRDHQGNQQGARQAQEDAPQRKRAEAEGDRSRSESPGALQESRPGYFALLSTGSRVSERYRRSPHLICYWEGPRLVLQNYAAGTRVSASPQACQLLHFFDRWRAAGELAASFPDISARISRPRRYKFNSRALAGLFQRAARSSRKSAARMERLESRRALFSSLHKRCHVADRAGRFRPRSSPPRSHHSDAAALQTLSRSETSPLARARNRRRI